MILESVIVVNTSLISEANVISKAYHHKQNLHNCVKITTKIKEQKEKKHLRYSPREDLQNGKSDIIASVSNNIFFTIQIRRGVITNFLFIRAF